MTRLVEKDVKDIDKTLKDYDDFFKRQTGCYMCEIACRAAGITEILPGYKIAVVPSTTGEGIISGFSESVCAILKHCTLDAFVTSRCDVDGIYEAIQKGADMIFSADDRFIAFGTAVRAVAENGICTGEGFAEALLCSMRDQSRKVLILGASSVGRAAAGYLAEKKVPVDMYDTNADVLKNACAGERLIEKLSSSPVLKKYTYIYDATTSGDFITEKDVSAETVIAAPGMPRGITEKACEIATVIHNPLELGVITMYYVCAKQMYLKEREMGIR